MSSILDFENCDPDRKDINLDIEAGLGHANANYMQVLSEEGKHRMEVRYPIDAGSASNTYSPVANPKHYNEGGIECIDALRASMSHEEYKGYLKGCAFKYLWRYRYKGHPIEDLQKSIWYSQRLTMLLQEEKIEDDADTRMEAYREGANFVGTADRVQPIPPRGEAPTAERDIPGSSPTGRPVSL